ncbi:carboxyl transferase domain-containing protein [Methylobacterium oryzae]|uniref:Acetyl-coenzyme A carboxylase carboxyl transferase subunit beta domain-containing protein n=1 Tax=Methylobacterium oryzae TaxID=334852 RepID=A0ABU7TM10_9HYPH
MRCHGDPERIAARTGEHEDRLPSPLAAVERDSVDAVITPHATRRRIAEARGMLRTKTMDQSRKTHDNIPL